MMRKKFMRGALCLGMATMLMMSAGCGNNGGGDGEDDAAAAGKTVITVGTYPGGLGDEWLKEAAKRFEEHYATKSFEDEKTGVYVKVEECLAGDMLVNRSFDKDVYLTEAVDYYYMQKLGKIADISSVATDDLGEYGESGKTVSGKLDKAMNDFLTAKDGKYYAIPFYEGFYGFVYDVDMFALNGWFFDENGNFTKTNKSKGIDGVAGTYDDGMPKTYAQFSQLLAEIVNDNITPFVYSSESMVYFSNMLASVWADYEGKDKMQMNWSLTGTTDVITSFNGDGTPVIGAAEISESNINDLQKQPGKYYALKFLKEVLMSNGKNYNSESDFKTAQLKLIQSCLDGEMQDGAAAMVIDGSWFENEADISGTFETAQMLDAGYSGEGEYKKTRKFAFMPIPMVDDSATTLNNGSKNENGTHKQTLFSSNDAFCFISAATSGAKLDVSKEFLKFLHTDAELAKFTTKTSITCPYTYTVADKDSMSYFGKSLMEMKQSSDIVYPYSNHTYYVANSSQFMLGQWGWKSKVGGDDAKIPFTYMRDNADVTAKQYFEGLYLAH